MRKQSIANRALGQTGESIAATFLQKKGWRIHASNWRPDKAKHGVELDIVAQDKTTLVFVEVKTRTDGQIIPVYAALTKQKKDNLVRVAQAYLTEHSVWDMPCRFDLICLWKTDNNTFELEHYTNVIEIGNTMGCSNSSWQPW